MKQKIWQNTNSISLPFSTAEMIKKIPKEAMYTITRKAVIYFVATCALEINIGALI